MRSVSSILFILIGFALALLTAGGVRLLPGALGAVSVVALVLTVVVFTLPVERALTVAAGAGMGFDLFSGYPFLTWTIIILVVAFGAIQLFRRYLTNRSLFALLTLGLAVQITIFVVQLVVSRGAAFITQGVIFFRLDAVTLLLWIKAVAFELLLLYLFFLLYVKTRGGKAGTLTHLSPFKR